MLRRAPTQLPPPADLGVNIRAARLAAGLTRAELAVACRHGESSVIAWENGLRYPSLATLAAIADALDVTPGDLLSARDNAVA